MKLQFKVFLIVAIATIIFSCKKKDNDKIELQPDELAGAFVDTNFSLKAFSVQLDSTLSGHFDVNKHLVGSYNSSIFGEVNSSFFTQLDIPDDGYNAISDDAEFISAQLWLYKSYFYGESNGNIDISINQISEDLIYEDNNSEFKDYYVFDKIGLSQNLQNITYISSEDSLVVDLSNSFQNLIWNLRNQSSTVEDFNADFKGLAFASTTGNGILGFDSKKCFIKIKYKDGTDEVIEKDFFFNDEVAHFNRIASDRSGTDFSDLTNDNVLVSTSNLNNKMLVQAGTRVEGVLNFEDLNDKLFNTDQLIYKAEIEVPVTFSDDVIFTEDSYEAFLIIKDENNETVGLPSSNLAVDKFVLDVTQQMQEVLGGVYKLGNINLLLSQKGHKIDNFVVDNPEQNIKIKIYFNQK